MVTGMAQHEHRSPDPVAEPQAYQQHLLDLLGDNDPAEVQESTPRALRALVEESGDRLRSVPEPGEWSVHGCIAHVTDAELVMSGRYRWVLAHDEPPLIGYDQDLWVDRLHAGEEPVEELLALFEPLRVANVELWRRTPVEARARVGIHAERGPETYDLAFRMLAGHDRFHIDQARRALDAAGG
jgi:hypothetical protein